MINPLGPSGSGFTGNDSRTRHRAGSASFLETQFTPFSDSSDNSPTAISSSWSRPLSPGSGQTTRPADSDSSESSASPRSTNV